MKDTIRFIAIMTVISIVYAAFFHFVQEQRFREIEEKIEILQVNK